MLSYHDLEDFMGIDAALDENEGTAAGGKGRISPGRISSGLAGDAEDAPAERDPD
ncbi:hypothetical protein IGS68_25950 [Skermanella sp. TT6]|uniref:Uncharacterized protein n=1 Tax=Skermanella cutis TaxID=2775420 RepID=A0ABX7B4W2_9PROT|nr:hypothetical protein [Skermanella sp. TT6]QQP89383.1 hypothetical protein IGS68_25950 [Skermanella sp. TT6]